MNETINLMNAHTSVRRFTEEQISDKELRAIIDAGRAGCVQLEEFSVLLYHCGAKQREKRSPL